MSCDRHAVRIAQVFSRTTGVPSTPLSSSFKDKAEGFNGRFMDPRLGFGKPRAPELGMLVAPPNSVRGTNSYCPYMLTNRTVQDGVSGWTAEVVRHDSGKFKRKSDRIFISDSTASQLPMSCPNIDVFSGAAKNKELARFAVRAKSSGNTSRELMLVATRTWARLKTAGTSDRRKLQPKFNNQVGIIRELVKLENEANYVL